MEDLQIIERDNEKLPVISTREVAIRIGKTHQHILRDIREKSLSKFGQWVIPSKYCANNGQEYDEYLLTKDGFIMLVFNYEGYLDFKEAYIKRFNEMEAQLKQPLALPAAIENKLNQIEKTIDSIHESLQGEVIDEPRSFRSTCGCSVYQYEKKIDELHNAIKERNKEVNRMHSFQLELKEAFRYILYEAKDLYSVKKTAEKAYEELNRSHCGFYICF